MPTYIKTGLWENLKTTAPKNWLNLTKLINDNISSNYKPSILDSLKITDTAPTTQGLYILSGAGTYTNLGGLVTTADKLNYAYFDGTTWSLIAVDMPITNNNTGELLPTSINTIGKVDAVNDSSAYIYPALSHSYCIKNTIGSGKITKISFKATTVATNKRFCLIRNNTIIYTIYVDLAIGLNNIIVDWDSQFNDYIGVDSSFNFAYKALNGIGFIDLNMSTYSGASISGTIPLSFELTEFSLSQSSNNIFKGKKMLLYGDSRFSADYSFTKTFPEIKLQLLECYNGGFSGYTAAQLATNTCLDRIFNYTADFICILIGGNDNGASGTIGTFSSTSELASLGESLVSETNISSNYSGTKFIQAISHIIRKIDAYYYNFRSRANLTGSETESEKDIKIEAVKKPVIIICTDLPQKRNNSIDAFSLEANWKRKRLAIIEACEKYNFPYLDLYTEVTKSWKMDLEPFWTSPTNMTNNRGIYTMDGLHPNKYGMRFITTLIADKFNRIGNAN